MKIKDLTKYLDEKFPLRLQEKYDNTGEQISFGDKEIQNILISVDLDNIVIDEAIEKGVNLIISHHPFIFNPIKKIRTGNPVSDLLLKLIRNEISLYSAHTNLDKIYYNKLGEVLGLMNCRLLFKTDIIDEKEFGFGAYGELPQVKSLDNILKIIKKKFELEFIVYSGSKDKIIKTIAVLNGAGGGQIEKILQEHNVDCIVTGDICYHHSKSAQNFGVPVVDAGHFATERILLNFLREDVLQFLTKNDAPCDVSLIISEKEQNPFRVFI